MTASSRPFHKGGRPEAPSFRWGRVHSVSVGLDGADAPLDLQFGYELPLGSARLGLGVAHRVGSESGAGTSASLGVSFRF